jgi:site-specific recombinase XerD
MTVQQWVEQWHAARSPFRQDGSLIPDAALHPTTWLHDGTIIKKWIVPRLGPLALSDPNHMKLRSQCLDFKRTLEEEIGGKAVLNNLGLLHKAMADAVERALIAVNPVPRLKAIRGWARRLKKTSKPLSAEEVGQFLGALPKRVDMRDGAFVSRDTLNDVYYLWFRTGWRSNEIVTLRFDWLSPARQVVEVRQGRSPRMGGLEAAPKTGEREVVCDYDPALFDMFERRRRESLAVGARDYVFTDSKGRPLSQEWLAKRVWDPTLRMIGISDRGQYNIRDTFITIALSEGEDPGWVAEVCGTSEQMIFRHYRTWMPKLRRGHGQLLVNSLNMGPQIGPQGGHPAAYGEQKHAVTEWGGGNRPTAVTHLFSVCQGRRTGRVAPKVAPTPLVLVAMLAAQSTPSSAALATAAARRR